MQRQTIKSGGNTVKTAKEIMITLDLQKRIKKAAKQYTSIEDLLVYVNDQCEWYELSYERTMFAVDLAKKYFNKLN